MLLVLGRQKCRKVMVEPPAHPGRWRILEIDNRILAIGLEPALIEQRPCAMHQSVIINPAIQPVHPLHLSALAKFLPQHSLKVHQEYRKNSTGTPTPSNTYPSQHLPETTLAWTASSPSHRQISPPPSPRSESPRLLRRRPRLPSRTAFSSDASAFAPATAWSSLPSSGSSSG